VTICAGLLPGGARRLRVNAGGVRIDWRS